ncbi:hypothetical protein HY635_02835 [Candidatus Uhrbacteria bacterium]|nr:hypothetical protein [Candidatus Uhrbacteria bacterium]
MNWSQIPTWLLLIGGAALWLLFGAVFGSHGEQIRNTIRSACHAVADALRAAATAVLSWAQWCFTNVERFVGWLGDRLPKWEDAPAASPSAAPADATSELNPTIAALAAVALLFAVALNGYLLYEITPDLFSFSPNDLKEGAGRFISLLVPLAILAGEVIGGIIVKSEQRRRGAGVTEASTSVPWVVFLFCYCVEVAAGIRRALSYLESASPFADETTHITGDSVATAALWAILAGGIPWVIFLLSRYVEPALSRSDAARGFIRFVGQLIRFVATLLAVVVAALVVSLTLGLGGVVTGLVGCSAHILSGAVRYVVYGVLFVLVIALIDASGMTVTWFRGWRRTAPPAAPTAVAVLVLTAAFLGTGCGRSNARPPRSDRKFATVSVSDLKPAPKPESFDDVANVKLPKYLGEHHKVVQVLEPKLHVCLADVTASVDLELRRALLRKCAELVSELSPNQGPETTGIVVPIVDAALTSKLLVERLDGADVPVRCATNPPIPEFPSRSTVTDAKMKSMRESFERAERDCTESVGRAYAMATRTRSEQRGEFIGRVLRELGNRVYPRTDILGALGYVAEFVRAERARFGRGLQVRLSIISDLEDDANGCTYSRGKVSCPAAPMRATRTLLQDSSTRYQIHQVLQSTIASRRGNAYAEAKGATEARQRAWREFWVAIAPDHVEPFTFTAPAGRRATAGPPPAADPGTNPGQSDSGATEGSAQCSSIDLLRAKRDAVERQTLSVADWLAYGRALASCGPRTKPWEAVGLSDRERFEDAYVIPFVNGDAGQGSLFQTQEPAAYQRIIRAWGIEG